MATVAFLVCTAFVLYLLEVERSLSRGSSPALWIPTIWMMIAASRPIATWFDTVGVARNNEAGSAIDFWTLVALAVLGGIVLARRRINWSRTLKRHRWLLLVLAYMLLSTLWSEITLIAIKRWVRELIVVEMAMVVVSEKDPRKALASIFRRSAYVLLPFSLLLIRYYPTLGRMYGRWSGIEMWVGVGRQKNQLGRLCMVLVFFLFFDLYNRWRLRERRPRLSELWPDILMIILGGYLLIGSDSMTSITTLAIGVTVYLSRRRLQKLPQLVIQISIVLLLFFGVSMPFMGGSSVGSVTSQLGRDSTLTGRTDVWADLMAPRAERPLLGYGFGSFWTDLRREQYEIPTAHNGYLDILLELGEAGLIVYSIWLLSCGAQLHRALIQEPLWAGFALSLLFMSLIYNATESAFNSLSEFPTAVLLFAYLAATAPLTIKRSVDQAVTSVVNA